MKRSKLDTYLDVLMVLARGKPLKITNIGQKANLNCDKLKENLDYLISLGMAEKRLQMEHHTVHEFYMITQKGISTLRYYKDINQVLPITEKIS
jgi:predicted transcriptional regulator